MPIDLSKDHSSNSSDSSFANISDSTSNSNSKYAENKLVADFIEPLSDAKIIDSWHKNAAPWTDAVRGGQIQSRKLVTDRAIVEAILSCAPQSVFDIGCGEGWLVRELAEHNIRARGVDVVPELIERARQAGGDFLLASYEAIAAGKLTERADLIVCNFSLIGNESVANLLRSVPRLLNPCGAFIVQTLHPRSACDDQSYRDGWRSGSWSGFSSDFTDPAWYFRTLESWTQLFIDSGLHIREMREPIHPGTGQAASLLFIAAVAADNRRQCE
jgi:2-polyprenyl-3-methyl-5-hydroxy-6-metoxy-1,4-benzoquinol methylase